MSIIQYKNYDRILVAIDCIILGFDGNELKALLIQRNFEPEAGKWSLMGGFVQNKEAIDEAAKRILLQLTGLHHVYMEQLLCFGDTTRDPGGRVISIAYYALIKIADHAEELMHEHQAKWFSLHNIPSLIFDHNRMIELTKERLKQKIASYPVGFELLPTRFTLLQLQNLYEAIYETALDKRNFNRKILSLKLLKKLDEKDKLSSRKGAFYYVFDDENYKRFDLFVK